MVWCGKKEAVEVSGLWIVECRLEGRMERRGCRGRGVDKKGLEMRGIEGMEEWGGRP